tara:strand:+ start:282 stop:437 length:156 start_codon:yes stop_codon:yes gene_type:complete
MKKIDIYKLLPDKTKDKIAEEISKTLNANNLDNSAFTWDISCQILEINEDL